MGRSSRSRSHSPAASRCPTACREMPSSVAASAWVRPSADQGDRLPRLVAAPVDHDGQRAEHRLGVPGVGGRRAAHGQPGRPLLGRVHGPAGAEERRAGTGPGARRQRGLHGPGADADAPAAGTHQVAGRRRRPRRDRRGPPGTRRRPSARTASTVGTAALSRGRTSATRSALRRLAFWSTVSTYGTRASLTAFIAGCKPQSLSTTSGGKPPVAIGPQPVIVTRSSDFPCRRHRRPVLVPVGVLAADRPVVLDQRLQRLGQVQHLGLAVDLHPGAVPVRRTARTARPPGPAARWPPSPAADRWRRRSAPRRPRRSVTGDSWRRPRAGG